MHLLTLLLAGLGSGVAALGWDLAMLRVTRGVAPMPDVFVVGSYLLVGAAAAIAATWLARRLCGGSGGLADTAATALLLVYAVPFAERLYQVASLTLAPGAAVATAAVAVVLVSAAAAALARLLGDPSRWLGPGVLALGIGAGLAVNRSLAGHPLSPRSLALDLAVASAILLVVVLVRGLGAAAGLAAAFLIAGTVALGVDGTVGPGTDRQRPVAAGSPNLVVVVVDTLRADVLESVLAGTPEGRRLDRELAGAAWFGGVIATSPWTAPSVGSIWTGLHPEEHGFGARTGDPDRPLRPLSAGSPTLAERLSRAGYRCEALVANSMLHHGSGVDRGFDRYEVLLPAAQTLPLSNALILWGVHPPELYLPAADAVARARARLSRLARSDGPFFLWLHLMDPHAPLMDHPELTEGADEAALPELDRRYRREVRYAAAATADLLRRVDELGLGASTVVVVTSDHGEMLPSDGHDSGVRDDDGRPIVHGHGHGLFEELVRVPLAIRPAAAVGPGRRVADLASQVDLLPTLLDLLGQPPVATAHDGRSLAGRVRGEVSATALPERRWAFSGAPQIGPPQRSVRGDRHKLIRFPGREVPDLLFDVSVDPLERHDLAATADSPRRELEAALAIHDGELRPVGPEPAPAVAPEVLRMLQVLGYAP